MASIEERIDAKQEKANQLFEEYLYEYQEFFDLCSQLAYDGTEDLDVVLEIPSLLEQLQDALSQILDEKKNKKFFSKIEKLQEQIEELESR